MSEELTDLSVAEGKSIVEVIVSHKELSKVIEFIKELSNKGFGTGSILFLIRNSIEEILLTIGSIDMEYDEIIISKKENGYILYIESSLAEVFHNKDKEFVHNTKGLWIGASVYCMTNDDYKLVKELIEKYGMEVIDFSLMVGREWWKMNIKDISQEDIKYLFEYLIDKIKNLKTNQKEISIGDYIFILRYIIVRIELEEGIYDEVEFSRLNPKATEKDIANVVKLVFDVRGFYKDYLTEFVITRNSLNISPERDTQHIKNIINIIKEGWKMNIDKMNLPQYIEYIKSKLDEIEWVAKNEEIHEDYKKNIVTLLDNIDKNIYEIYVLIEGYFGWEDFIWKV